MVFLFFYYLDCFELLFICGEKGEEMEQFTKRPRECHESYRRMV